MMQFMAGIFVWTTLVTINIVFTASSFWLLLYWQVKNNQLHDQFYEQLLPDAVSQLIQVQNSYNSFSTPYQIQLLSIGFYAMIIMTTLIFLLSLAMIKRVKIAVAIIEETSRAIAKMPWIGTKH